jgi:peptidoglycan hydrolase-like protein with peptidoglycan-binding domain
MRFYEFKLRESKETVYVVGDSIAVGIKNSAGAPGIAVGGKNSKQVLEMVKTLVRQYNVKGSTVILSSGASNSTYERKNGQGENFDIDPVIEQLTVLKDAGAKVVLVGTGSGQSKWITNKYGEYRINFKDQNINSQLESAAKQTGATFLGPLEKYDPNLNSDRGDGIHPYSGYQKLYDAGIKGSTASPAGQSGTPSSTSDPNKNDKSEPLTKIDIPSGRVGKEVADIQKVLVALGYPLPKYGIDGIRGAETSGAIRAFQTDNKLTVDGDPGPETVGKLNDILKSKPELSKKLTQSTASDVKSRTPDRALGSYTGNASAGVGETGNAREAVQFFISKGWTPAQAAGIVGNLQAESGANMKTNAVGDGGKAYGIAQWHPDRQANFQRAFGKDIREAGFKEQLAFVQWEFENTERNAAAKLKQATTPEQAAWVVDEYYERSSGAHRQRRIDNALALAPKTTSVS